MLTCRGLKKTYGKRQVVLAGAPAAAFRPLRECAAARREFPLC